MNEAFAAGSPGIRTRRLFPLVSIALSGCASAPQPIERRPVPDFVVSEVVVPLPLADVRATLLKGLTVAQERGDPAYRSLGFVSRDSSGSEAWAPAIAEERNHALLGAAFFRDSTHDDDLFVHFMGTPIVSSDYRANGHALDYAVTFSIRLAAMGDSATRMTIRTVDSRTFLGSELNVHAMGFVPKAVPVPESPIDQYKLLTYAAHLAGVRLTPIGENPASRPGVGN